jgi:transposase
VERVRQSRHGPISRVTAEVEEQLREELRRQPDLTLQELGERLEHRQQLRLSRSRLWVVLRRMGLRRKKNRSMRPSRTARKPNGGGKAGGRR